MATGELGELSIFHALLIGRSRNDLNAFIRGHELFPLLCTFGAIFAAGFLLLFCFLSAKDKK